MKNKLNVLYLTEDYEPIYGGVTSVVKNSVRALSKFANVTIGTVNPPKHLRSNFKEDQNFPAKIVRCKGHFNYITTNMSANLTDSAFKKEIESGGYDIIHCHFPLGLYKYALKLRKKYQIPVAITAHSYYYPDFKAVIKNEAITRFAVKFVTKSLNKANRVFCVSGYAKNILEQFGLKNSEVLPNAVDMTDFCPTDQNFKNEIIKKYNIKQDDFVMISVGRLVSVKNFIFNIYAFSELHKQFKNTKYLIVGDGELYDEMQKLINRLNLQDCCFLLGSIKNKKQLGAVYELSSIVSFMSIGDSCGLIQFEGAFFKKPTIALQNTAVGEFLIDNKNGVILEGNKPQDAEKDSIKMCFDEKVVLQQFVEKVGCLINNPPLLQELGQNAYNEVFRTYDDTYASNLIETYKQIIKEFKASQKLTEKNYIKKTKKAKPAF
ncbi:MAG: glycosyltransferase family 4 protein [Clostridiales bacterium]|nr:glycosyltransferase family 4 protein [Clostridiales bacterium]